MFRRLRDDASNAVTRFSSALRALQNECRSPLSIGAWFHTTASPVPGVTTPASRRWPGADLCIGPSQRQRKAKEGQELDSDPWTPSCFAQQVGAPRGQQSWDAVERRPLDATVGITCAFPSKPHLRAGGYNLQPTALPQRLVGSRRLLHGMVSVMTAAESARDLLNAVIQPVAYNELAAHLARDYSTELFDALSGLVLCHVDELSGPEMSNLLWAYATVGHRDSRLMTPVLQSLADKMQELNSQQLTNTFWAMSRLGLYDPQLVSVASEQIWDRLPGATARQLAAIVQSYAFFQQQDPQLLAGDEDLLQGIISRFRSQLPSASPAEIAVLLSALARLRHSDAALMDEACAALSSAGQTAELRSLAEVIWACAVLQHRNAPFLEFVADRVTEALRLPVGMVPVPIGLQGMVVVGPKHADEARAAEVPSSLVAIAPAAEHAAVPSQLAGLGRDPEPSLPQSSGLRAQPRSALPRQSYLPPQRSSSSRSHEAEAADGGGSGACRSGSWLPGLSAWPGDLGARLHSVRRNHSGPCGLTFGSVLFQRFNPALHDEGEASSGHGSSISGSDVAQAEEPPASGSAAALSATPDSITLVDGDTVSKLLWAYGVLQCYSGPLYTLLFKQLPRVHDRTVTWFTLSRLMGAQLKALELQPGHGLCRINPLEAESASAWARLLRIRTPVHMLPDRFLSPAFVAFQTVNSMEATVNATAQGIGAAAPGLRRSELEGEVATALCDLGLALRPNATIDGMFYMRHTAMLNGLSICLEVLSVSCCTAQAPHRPLGLAAARLQSLEFRGWKALVVPFYEWEALAVDDRFDRVPRQLGGAAGESLPVLEPHGAAVARQKYLRRKLEDLIGEELPPLYQKATKRRMV